MSNLSSRADNVTRRGVTLIECMVAMSVLVIGLFAIVGVLSASFSGISDTRNSLLASQVAREQLDI